MQSIAGNDGIILSCVVVLKEKHIALPKARHPLIGRRKRYDSPIWKLYICSFAAGDDGGSRQQEVIWLGFEDFFLRDAIFKNRGDDAQWLFRYGILIAVEKGK